MIYARRHRFLPTIVDIRTIAHALSFTVFSLFQLFTSIRALNTFCKFLKKQHDRTSSSRLTVGAKQGLVGLKQIRKNHEMRAHNSSSFPASICQHSFLFLQRYWRKPIKHERNVRSIKRHRSINRESRGSQREPVVSIDRRGEGRGSSFAKSGWTARLYVAAVRESVRSDSCNFTASCHHPIYNAHPLSSSSRFFHRACSLHLPSFLFFVSIFVRYLFLFSSSFLPSLLRRKNSFHEG